MRSDITGIGDVSKPRHDALPPGQRATDGLPRFGTLLYRPPPLVPADPAIEIVGCGVTPFAVRLTELTEVQSVELIADLHCVAGWSATNLRWKGVPFEHLYREVIQPALSSEMAVTHFVFAGLDGYRCVVAIEDALAEDVLIAHSLNGRPLDPDHGAPLRLVSPSQYGYVSVKHLCRIELHTSEPDAKDRSVLASLLTLRLLFEHHPRARVWHEERNGALPTWLVRPIYRLLTPPIRILSAPPPTPRRAGTGPEMIVCPPARSLAVAHSVRVVRALLAILAAYAGAIGAYAVLTPHGFYDNVVGVDRLGPYNQHLTSDVGGLYLGFALLFAWATITLGRELGRAAAAAFALAQAIHLGYHLAHLEPFTVAQGVEEMVGLLPLLALPVLVVILTQRVPR